MTKPVTQESRGVISDSAANLFSFLCVAAVGAILNLGLVMLYEPAVLGSFNQVYAFYVIFTQLFVFGLSDSAQRHVAINLEQPVLRRTVELSAFLLACVYAVAGLLCYQLLGGFYAHWAQSDALLRGIALTAPGAACFIVNKVLLGIVAGRKRLKHYAAFQIFRAVVIFLGFVAIVAKGDPYGVPLVFSLAEVLLLPVLCVLVWDREGKGFAQLGPWIRRHARFGLNARATSSGPMVLTSSERCHSSRSRSSMAWRPPPTAPALLMSTSMAPSPTVAAAASTRSSGREAPRRNENDEQDRSSVQGRGCFDVRFDGGP